MAIVGQCRGWDVQTERVRPWHEHQDVFPHVPERSRFNRRLRTLMPAINRVRQAGLSILDVAHDRHCTSDSVPIAVVQLHLVPDASREWAVYHAPFGTVVPKKQTRYGDTLHLLVTRKGVIIDCVLALAHASELTLGQALLLAHTDLVVLGDKGSMSQRLATQRAAPNRLHLRTIPRRNQQRQLVATVARLLKAQRHIIETVHDHLTQQCGIAPNHAHRFWGVCTRLYAKLTAHTLSIYLNRLLGNVDFLQIKHVAFPN